MTLKTKKHILFIFVFIFFCIKAKCQTPVLFNTNDSVSNIVLPNVFTPNFDSINDVFRPILDEITDLNFKIYNRNGNLIFETANIHGFWDGRSTSGEACIDGVYFCVLNATGIDGKKFNEKTFIQLFTNGYYK